MPVWSKLGIEPTTLYTQPVQQVYEPNKKKQKEKKKKKETIWCLSEKSWESRAL